MKKIFLLVFAFVMCKIGYAQYPMTQFIGTDSAIVVSKGAMQSRFVNVVFADTTTANSQRIKQYPGAMIYAAGKLWYRNATATGWVELTSTSTDTNIYNSDGTLTGPRTLNGNNDDLTFDNMAYFSVNANPSGQVRFYQGSNNNILMRGDTTAISRRLSYNTNLGSSFTKHSLIDKNYVDSSFSLNINGTTNYVPKFTSSSAIGNSQIFDNGTSVGIATATPSAAYRLDIEGNVRVRSGQILAFSNFNNTNTYQLYNIGGSGAGGETLVFTNGTTERMRLDALGRLGINETSITSMLQVKDVGGGNLFKFTSGTVVLESYVSGGVPSLGTTSNTDFRFRTNDTERMRITSGGNVGIGTTSPQTQLDIANGLMFGTIDAFPSATYDAAAVIAKTGSLGSAPFNNAGSIVYRARVTSTAGRSSHIFYTGSPSTERMRLDESGNLGLGVTPSAWSGAGSAMNIGTVGSLRADAFTMGVNNNTFFNGSNWIYQTTRQASRYEQVSGQHQWFTAPSGTAGNAITFTQAMTLDASGNLLVATTSPSYNAVGRGNITIGGSSSSILGLQVGGVAKGYVYHDNVNYFLWNTANGYMGFGTNDTERMRLTSGGLLGIGTASPQSILDITAATPIMTISASTNTVLHGIEWKSGTSLDAFIKQQPNTGEFRISNGRSAVWGGFITFYTDISERMRLTSAGELLINTTSDAGDYKLQVNGNVLSTNQIYSSKVTNQSTISNTTTNASLLLVAPTTTSYYGGIIGWAEGNIATSISAYDDGSGGALGLVISTGNNTTLSEALRISSTQNATFAGSIKTAAPSGGTAKPWRLGNVATVSPTSPDRTIEVEIDGVTYYIHAKTTNN